jgi:hypothetical protein
LTLVAMVKADVADTPWFSSCRGAVFVLERKTERSACRLVSQCLACMPMRCNVHICKVLGWWGRGGGALTGLARLGKAEFCGRINAGREKSQGSGSAQRLPKDATIPVPLFCADACHASAPGVLRLHTMLAAPWVCRSCVRSLRRARIPQFQFIRRASTGTS